MKVTRINRVLFLALFIFISCKTFSQVDINLIKSEEENFQVIFPKIIVKNISYKIYFIYQGKSKIKEISIYHNNRLLRTISINEKDQFSFQFQEKGIYRFYYGTQYIEKDVNPIPLWFSILPPLLAILMALLFKEVYFALFTGLLVGTASISYFQGANFFTSIFQGIFRIVDSYIIQSLSKTSHLSIIIFSVLIGATVKIISANGGMHGVIKKLTKYANNRYSGQLVTWILGLLIFFDDYANTLLVGNAMRKITDRLKISREKLAYIVDSTAAPITSIALVTTWIGAELSYIEGSIKLLDLPESAYSIFIRSLQYSFYPIFTLIFILFLILKKKDFGPMLKAERKSEKGKLSPGYMKVKYEKETNKVGKAKWYNAAIPILVIVFGSIAGLLYTGWDTEIWESKLPFTTKITTIIGAANSYKALLWASFSGMSVAIILTFFQKILSIKKTVESFIAGISDMIPAILILTLAWSLALLTVHLHTAEFMTNLLTQLQIKPFLVPALTFIIAALVSFSTGSSWGTMAILYPVILPASWQITQFHEFSYDASMTIYYNVVSCVLAGSVLGDHCSPISDTTILSSLASACHHIEHVRTQLPYALLVGAVAIFIGTIPAALGISSFILIPIGLGVLYLSVISLGRKI